MRQPTRRFLGPRFRAACAATALALVALPAATGQVRAASFGPNGNGNPTSAPATAHPLIVPFVVGNVTVTNCTTAGYNNYILGTPNNIGLGGALAHGNVITFACNTTLSGAGPYTIVPPSTPDGVGVPVGINVTSGSVSIDGSDGGAFDVTIDGGTTEVVFEVGTGATLALANLTVAHGAPFARAGGVEVAGGTLTVTTSTFHDNVGAFGGAIDGGGFNYPCGAAITVTSSTFVNNTSAGNGGAIESCATTDVIANSTFVGNTGAAGGAVNFFNITNTLTVSLINNTFSGNTSRNRGGAVGAEKNGPAAAGTVAIANSILANNTATPPSACFSSSFPIVDNGGNLEYPTNSCGFSVANGDSFGNPNLGPLANNGGPTMTEALLAGSAALNLGLAATCILPPINDLDQRGVIRDAVLRGVCDSGAWDSAGGLLTLYGAFPLSGNPAARLGFLASENFAFPGGYITLQVGGLTVTARFPITITRAETCTAFPCTATVTLTGIVSSANQPGIVGDTVTVTITVTATNTAGFVRSVSSVTATVTTPGGALVASATFTAPFRFATVLDILFSAK